MTKSNLQLGFFIVIATVALISTLWLFLPFLAPILLAAVLAIVFYPAHKQVMRVMPMWPSLAAFVSTVLILVLILIPLVFFGWLVVEESAGVYQSLVSNGNGLHVLPSALSNTDDFLGRLFSVSDFHLRDYVTAEKIVLSVLTWVQTHVGELFTRAIEYVLGAFILVMALFSLLRDGPKFVEGVVKISPLRDTFDRKIIDRVGIAVNSVIMGEVVIALLQGILLGIGFWVFGVPNAAIWGFVTAIAAFIPTVGTGIVMVPGVLYVFALVGWIPAAGLLAWGAILVGLVDNLLRPIVIERGMHIHPFLILISVLGGIHVFGPIGFIAGPVMLGFFFALLDIYPLIIEQLAD